MSLIKRFFAVLDEYISEKVAREKLKYRHKFRTLKIRKKKKKVQSVEGKLKKNYKNITGKKYRYDTDY